MVISQKHTNEKPNNHKIAVGKILGPWGLKGEVKFLLYNPSSEILFKTRQIFLLSGFVFEKHELSSVRQQGRYLLLHFKGLNSPEKASELKGKEVWVGKEALPVSQEGEYYFEELIGFKVVDLEGKEFGEVLSLANYGASDLLVIKQGNTEYLVPYAEGWIEKVVAEEKKIIVTEQVWGL